MCTPTTQDVFPRHTYSNFSSNLLIHYNTWQRGIKVAKGNKVAN